MAKLKHLFAAISFLTTFLAGEAQSYTVQYRNEHGDTSFVQTTLQKQFSSKQDASLYITSLPSLLKNQGYITASIDDVVMDSLSASVQLFLGEQYKWANIDTRPGDEVFLRA